LSRERPTSADVAKLAGVSRTTVSFILNNVPGTGIPESTIQKVLAAARELNYHPNITGRKLATGKSMMIGLVQIQTPEQALNDAFLLQVLMGIEQAAQKNNFHVLLKHIAHSTTSEYADLFAENHVDGIILSGPLQRDNTIENLYKEGHPILLLGQMEDTAIPFVDIDAEACSQNAVNHLISLGHRRIALITNTRHIYSSALQRKNGYQRAMQKAGLEIIEDYMQEGNFTPISGYEATKRLLSLPLRPTAIFVASDVVAIGAIQAIKDADLRIPEDISIVGFDDIPTAQYFDPPLTTIRLPAYALGYNAGDRLIRIINGGDLDENRVFLETKFIVRETTSAPPI
jgi:LacI family transcriptional regulator